MHGISLIKSLHVHIYVKFFNASTLSIISLSLAKAYIANVYVKLFILFPPYIIKKRSVPINVR
jgi:hypothetical protein